MQKINCDIKPYIQPFERKLALAELRSLTGTDPHPIDGSADRASKFYVPLNSGVEVLQSHLAYWEIVDGGRPEQTQQLRREATYAIARNGVSLNEMPAHISSIREHKAPNKRCLRYGTHGLHEYRGKFFPQLVRSLINIARVPSDGTVVDPMCGSGTTIVEAASSGRTAIGLDMNPLSVYVSKVKCDLLHADPRILITDFEILTQGLRRKVPDLSARGHYNSLPTKDQEYLSQWFDISVLKELDFVESCIRTLPHMHSQDLFTISLSNILREVSWQKDADLRVRKEQTTIPAGFVIKRFLDEALRSAKSVVAFLTESSAGVPGRHKVIEGDARTACALLPDHYGGVDAIITSPPYATALPYLDTDRLSLIYLGLLSRPEHRSRDKLMIGNREITEKTRRGMWEHYKGNKSFLPASIQDLIDRVSRLNDGPDTGFRRRNTAALLANYFFDMREAITQNYGLLRSGGQMFMIVGNNRTVAGGQEVLIETAKHLAELAMGAGFSLTEMLSMEMLSSRDIFRANATPSEFVISLRKS
ncbi:TRM11 family methyltransferase [Methylobacterium sp. R2-1]|uniref:TRM11 family SAM-dependent methyltransferase n=1 Tax=Methylobacterium sp. R2-1 TaxID=2587064 RepID=UPI0016107153|nr:DNA methyltransferase [Methylobacterium sp. R2-1]MBB2961818.1 site-specific DNA-methyltransferase (cytosine-N4-specific) [Methylobacterium sp. R2-1]